MTSFRFPQTVFMEKVIDTVSGQLSFSPFHARPVRWRLSEKDPMLKPVIGNLFGLMIEPLVTRYA